jgi:hypothetical protein
MGNERDIKPTIFSLPSEGGSYREGGLAVKELWKLAWSMWFVV